MVFVASPAKVYGRAQEDRLTVSPSRRRPRIDLQDVPAYGLLAGAAYFTAAIEAIAWSQGNPVALFGSGLLLVVAVVFTVAAWMWAAGRRPQAAILGGITLLGSIPGFGWLYQDGRVLVLVVPIAFVIALPHLRGRALILFASLALVDAMAVAPLPFADAIMGPETSYQTFGMMFGIVVVCGLLFLLTWRAYRTAERQSERYARLVADLPTGIVRLAAGGQILEANDALVRMLRYPSREALLAAPGEVIYGAQGQAGDRIRPQEDGLVTGQLRVRRFDGTEGWVRVRIHTTRDEAGAPAWFDGVVEDVTAERAELEAQNRLAAIVGSAPDGIYAITLDGVVQSWNPTAERIFGETAASAVGRSIFEFTPPEQHPRIRALIARVASGEHVGPFDASQRHPDGRTLTLAITASPVRDADGHVSAVALIARDVTDHRRLQADRERLEGQLRQAQKMEAIGRLAGGVAHDFNNLLTAIQGFGGIVAAELDGTLLEDQHQVLRAAARATELTHRLLAFSRHAPVSPRPVAVDTVLEDAFRMIRRLIPERIDLELDLRARSHVLADPVDIEQVLLNLVVNAIDATPGAGRIRIETTVEDLESPFVEEHLGTTSGPHVRIAVSDTGNGMDEATRAHIFEPFFTTKNRGEGTGLGLATVYAIVHRARGTIWADSVPGNGTTFTLYLPVAAPSTEPARPLPTPETPGTERILLVEDEEAVRMLTMRILERAGYSVVAAVSPAEALRLADGRSFDGVVSDVIMPGMSGSELAERLPAGLPIVFISGYTGHDGPELCLERDTRVLVTKPFDATEVTAALRRVLDAARSAPALSAETPPPSAQAPTVPGSQAAGAPSPGRLT
jgi:PAS domain S-box-containing protein